MPEISVIMPVYKVEKYLKRAVDSVLNQTFGDFELILVDDGSPDRCGEICDEYARKDNRIRVIHEENGGPGKARNAGLDYVYSKNDGKFLSFIDSDDWVHPRYLELLIKAAKDNKRKMAFTYFEVCEKETPFADLAEETKAKIIPSVMFYTNGGKRVRAYVWGGVYDVSIWKDVRFPEGKKWEDTAIFWKVILSEPDIAIVDAKLYYYFINPDGIVRSSSFNERLFELECYKQQIKYFKKHDIPPVYAVTVCQYVTLAVYKVVAALETSPENRDFKNADVARLKIEAKLAILKYKKEPRVDLWLKENSWAYYVIYPFIMTVVDKIKSITAGNSR